jgi:hypothetical protein
VGLNINRPIDATSTKRSMTGTRNVPVKPMFRTLHGLLSCVEIRRCTHTEVAPLAILLSSAPPTGSPAVSRVEWLRVAPSGSASSPRRMPMNAVCKGTVLRDRLSAPRAPDHPPTLDFLMTVDVAVMIGGLATTSALNKAYAPPRSPSRSCFNVPLLI